MVCKIFTFPPCIILYVPSLFLFKSAVRRGVLPLIIFADGKGVRVQKCPKLADIILEQHLILDLDTQFGCVSHILRCMCHFVCTVSANTYRAPSVNSIATNTVLGVARNKANHLHLL